MRWGFLHAVVKSGVGRGGSAASSAAWGRESKLWYSWSSIPGKTSWIFAAWETRQESHRVSLDVLQGHRRVPFFPLRERKEKKKAPVKSSTRRVSLEPLAASRHGYNIFSCYVIDFNGRFALFTCSTCAVSASLRQTQTPLPSEADGISTDAQVLIG